MWQNTNSLPLFLACSLILHSFIFWRTKIIAQNKREIDQIQRQLDLGKSQKKYIQVQLKAGEPNKPKQIVHNQSKKPQNRDEKKTKLDLSQLATQARPKFIKRRANSRTFKKQLKTKKAISSIRVKGRDYIRQRPQQAISHGQAIPYLKNSDFNVQIELPGNRKKDELNKEELIYYSFQKRTVQTYISSYLKNLLKYNRNNPHKVLVDKNHLLNLKAKVIYDKNGQIRRIRVMRSSPRGDVQVFFQDVLEGLVLPNPPKGLLNAKQEFSYYFTLRVKG